MNEISMRINQLRIQMKDMRIDGVYIPTDDFHLSEVVGEYFKEREFITGFTGSAGVCLVTQERAILWTDGRYFLQADEQLKNTGVELFKLGVEGFLSPFEYIKTIVTDGFVLASDTRVLSASFGMELNKFLQSKNATLKNVDLIDKIWSNRPLLSHNPVYELDFKYAGETRKDKILKLQNHLRDSNADLSVISSLDDIMWLLNLRGNDVKHSPVALSYVIVYQDKVDLYIQDDVVSDSIKHKLLADNVTLKPYFDVYNDLKMITGKVIMVSLKNINYAIYDAIFHNTLINEDNYTSKLKAIKNDIEIKNIKKAHLKDAVAMCKFIYWLKHSIDEKTEISAAEKLHEFRKMQKNFVDDSFETICGWAEHGAIVHYSATKETNVKIEKDNFLLVDSGGHYLEGTTDITRTIALGNVSSQMKKDFTLVLKSHICLSKAVFLKGTSGSNLDVLAREPLWENYLNYNHGTGHGVGYLLNVHEGPQNISCSRFNNVSLQEGMLTSNEPGLYLTNKYGIRHENLVLCQKDKKNEYGTFLKFEPVTLVPFDINAIDVKYLSAEERKYLNKYHALVYKKVSPYLDEKEKNWLLKVTKAI